MKKFLIVTITAVMLLSLSVIGASAANNVPPSDLTDTEWLIDPYYSGGQWEVSEGAGQFYLEGSLTFLDGTRYNFGFDYVLAIGYELDGNALVARRNSIVLYDIIGNDHVVVPRDSTFHLIIDGGENATDTSLRASIQKMNGKRTDLYGSSDKYDYYTGYANLPLFEEINNYRNVIITSFVAEDGEVGYELYATNNYLYYDTRITDISGVEVLSSIVGGSYNRYIAYDGYVKWFLRETQDFPDETFSIDATSFIWSKNDIYDIESGSLIIKGDPNFFTVNPTIRPLVPMEVAGVLPTILEFLKIIVPCGVGCLALLIILHLLARKFPTFLIKL